MNQPYEVVTAAIVSASGAIVVAIIGAVIEWRKRSSVEPGASAPRASRPTLVFVSTLALGFALIAGALIFWPHANPPGPTAGSLVPVGSVIAYWGPTTPLPSGYEVCDGNPVTTAGSPLLGKRKPNLGERFIRGAKGQVADTSELLPGGSSILLPEQLPFDFEPLNISAGGSQRYVGKMARGTPQATLLPPYQDLTYLIRVL
jgi:hypothetical protein